MTDPAKVRLSNGILLSLGEEQNVHFDFSEMSLSQIQKAHKECQLIQSYYNDIKNILRSKSGGN